MPHYQVSPFAYLNELYPQPETNIIYQPVEFVHGQLVPADGYYDNDDAVVVDSYQNNN